MTPIWEQPSNQPVAPQSGQNQPSSGDSGQQSGYQPNQQRHTRDSFQQPQQPPQQSNYRNQQNRPQRPSNQSLRSESALNQQSDTPPFTIVSNKRPEPPGEPESFTRAVRGETARQSKTARPVKIEAPQHRKTIEILDKKGRKKFHSHSEQQKKKKQVSSFIINVLALVLFSGIITSSYIMWPQIGALIERFQLDEDKFLTKMLDELFQKKGHYYDIRIYGEQWQATDDLKDKVGFTDGVSYFTKTGKLKVDQTERLSIESEGGDITVDVAGGNVTTSIRYGVQQDNSEQFIQWKEAKYEDLAWENSRENSEWIQYDSDSEPVNFVGQLLKNSLVDYNFRNYSLILPSVQLSEPDERKKAILDIKLKGVYSLSNCDPPLSRQQPRSTCDLEVNYQALLNHYVGELYEEEHRRYTSNPDKVAVPYYDVINPRGGLGDIWLPNRFKIKIDTINNLPVFLESKPGIGEDNPTKVMIRYLNQEEGLVITSRGLTETGNFGENLIEQINKKIVISGDNPARPEEESSN